MYKQLKVNVKHVNKGVSMKDLNPIAIITNEGDGYAIQEGWDL